VSPVLGADPGESAVIAALLGVGPAWARVGVGDDAAVLADDTPGAQRVVTMDTMVEGTHWDAALLPEHVGWKLVAVNVSDIAAMGAVPRWCTLALTLPRPLDLVWVEAFASGVRAACAHWGVQLVGGDTTRGPARVLTVTMEGVARHPVLRSTARAGDDLWVSGALGRTAEALLSGDPSALAVAWLRRPEPPLSLGIALAERRLARAMMDLSDGLRADLVRMCAASGVGARVDAARIPGVGPLAWKVAFGEDWELCFAGARADRNAICRMGSELGVIVSRIGCFTGDLAVRLEGHPLAPAWPEPLFSHFDAGRSA
jgi:thiamine-monophosphate kinase